MTLAALEKLVWILIYSGLLIVCLGIFVQRSDALLGWILIVAGAIDTAAGVVLVWVRSRRTDARRAP
ncbi:MAG: hypothetical protein KF863_15835 [Rubrivivax sp.]|nr:hypothetical protein [Rubrivivax sp.]